MKVILSGFRIAALAVCVALAGAPAPSLQPVHAQDDLQNTRFKGDPRLLRIQEILDEAGAGDLRPKTISIQTGMSSSRNRAAYPVVSRFILDLNATPVQADAQFEIVIRAIGIQESENGYFKTDNYAVYLVDNKSRQRETLAQAALSVRCNPRCPLPRPSEWRQMLLRMGE